MIKYSVKLNAKSSLYPAIKNLVFTENDSGNILEFNIVEKGNGINVADDFVSTVTYERPDGETFVTSSEIVDKTNCLIKTKIPKEVLSKLGKGYMSVQLYDGKGDRVTSILLEFNVTRELKPNGEITDEENYLVLIDLIKSVNELEEKVTANEDTREKAEFKRHDAELLRIAQSNKIQKWIDNPDLLKGSKGDKGETGPKGDKGETGAKGEKGDKGIQGPPGEKGEKGDPGEKGIQGEPGKKGDPGIQGLIGEKGDPGPKGDKGKQGEKGLKGDTGLKGDKGDTGPQGPRGPKGDKGEQGEIGVEGPRGLKGDKGEQGEIGVEGPRGLKGEKGDVGAGLNIISSLPSVDDLPTQAKPGDAYTIDGELYVYGYDGKFTNIGHIKGEKGETGERGPKGEKGDPGPKGEKGDRGIQGERGVQGLEGLKGDKGETGASGPEGPEGPAGIDGLDGKKGDKGDQGEQGIQGPIGPKGDKGEQGEVGPEGPIGPKGEKGDVGDPGIQGLPGKDGTDAHVTNENVLNAIGYTPANAINEHVHDNKTVIDKFSESGGEVLYNNQPISGGVSNWNELEGKPISLVEGIDNAVELKHPHNNKSIIDNFGYLNGELYYGETPLTFLPSEGGGDTLVHRYVHTSNKVIQPTGLNKTTGLFTTIEPINLPAGTKRQVITAFNYQANGIIPREWNPVDAHFIEVVDSYSFYILQGSASGARITYTNASNTGVDVNAFRFEYDFSNSPIIDLSALNIKNGRFRFKGTRHRPGWSYIYLNITHEGGNHQHNYGSFADGRDYLSLDILGLFSIEDNFVSARIDNYIKSEWNQSDGTWRYSQGNNGSVLAGYFDDPNFDNINIHFAVANGSVIEIYDITDSLNSGRDSIEIVDNLATDDGTKVLSAKQGKILNDNKVDNSRVLTDVPLNAKFTDTIVDISGKADKTQVLTNVPSGAKFTDTVTTVNGKTGAIAKSDITALGIPAQDTVYTHPVNHPPSIITQDANNRFVTDTEKATWNGKSNFSGNYNDLSNKPTIPDTSTLMPKSGGVLENYREKLTTVPADSGGIYLSRGNVFQHSPSCNITYSITNAVNNEAHSFTLIINMGSTVRALYFPPSVKWQGGEIPDLSTASKIYILTFMTVNGGTNWLGMFGGEF